MQRAIVLLALLTAAVAVVGCGGSTSASSSQTDPNAGVISQAESDAALERAASAYLLAHGARRATTDNPAGYWSRGDIYLPQGGPSCSVSAIFTGQNADIAMNAVRDASGHVAVKLGATAAGNVRCLKAGAAAIAGFAP